MQQDNIIIADLLLAAREARSYSQAKYSHYAVGAALRSKDGRIFRGTNIESSSYGLSICAERVALFKALSEGATEFTYLAIVTGNTPPATLGKFLRNEP
ncbi:MAG: cytidine deaminase [bacterium]|nr:cytidine deaminase [bacterium]